MCSGRVERSIGGLNLPLPDALPDKRIYELLKTVDLENLTFSDFQGVAQTIYAEQGAEDELRRIVLVNLARLAVKGNWDGLTSGGGGGSFGTSPFLAATDYFNDDYFDLLPASWGNGLLNGNASSMANTDAPRFVRFTAPSSAQISEAQIYLSTGAGVGNTLEVAIYEADSTTGLPTTRLGDTLTFPVGTGDPTGNISLSPLNGATLTRGSTYYLGWVRTSGSSPTLRGFLTNYGSSMGPVNSASAQTYNIMQLKTGVSNNTLPATMSTDPEDYDFFLTYSLRMVVKMG